MQIGWYAHPDATGHGYTTEAARAVLEYGLAAGLPEIRALTHTDNYPSMRVCDRLGMTYLGITEDWYDDAPSSHYIVRKGEWPRRWWVGGHADRNAPRARRSAVVRLDGVLAGLQRQQEGEREGDHDHPGGEPHRHQAASRKAPIRVPGGRAVEHVEEHRAEHGDPERAAELLHRGQHAGGRAGLLVLDAGEHDVEERRHRQTDAERRSAASDGDIAQMPDAVAGPVRG